MHTGLKSIEGNMIGCARKEKKGGVSEKDSVDGLKHRFLLGLFLCFEVLLLCFPSN